jgi:hypothetical protein
MLSTPGQEGDGDDMEIDEPPPPATSRSRSRSPLDAALISLRSATPLSVADLSRQLGRQTLQNHELPPRPDISSSQPAPTTTPNPRRRATAPQDYSSHVRQQRQTASRYQCTSSHRLRVSQLVERMLQEEDAGANIHYNLISKANEEETTTPIPDLSASTIINESHSFTSPRTTSPSAEEAESDPVLMWRTSQQSAFGVPYVRSSDAGAPPRRRNAVEKPIRMRRRAGGTGQRRKSS